MFIKSMWKDIKGFEGRYQMNSDTLEVKSLPFSIEQKSSTGNVYKRNYSEKICKKGIDSTGYYFVSLNGKNYRLHWLYYNTFIGDSTGYFIDHKDRNKLNNEPSNLRLLTQEDNNKNKTLSYKPDIQYRPLKSKKKPYFLRFSNGGRRYYVGNYSTYNEAENKYKELYNKRQKEIDDNN